MTGLNSLTLSEARDLLRRLGEIGLGVVGLVRVARPHAEALLEGDDRVGLGYEGSVGIRQPAVQIAVLAALPDAGLLIR